ncbi:hypothetical protein HXA34_20155 [Salipaludibacillus agaradhaerens]|jgi:hypothetical protein|uniref:hypothetical protein n=1 Tax=Salipaludibacillus agaradhaerens TaxID=76935 RepID=UPI0021512558|nr:hypothetical protein [Salipaludibacillus agaradhaerens]MCR6108605.1 hypothetical protein [Salipaludibacillus agaradhaerens]MCR6120634.1 hypothetical protein [Salipaludibacillus agaradhaerens]
MTEFKTKSDADVIPSPSSLHGDVIVYYVPVTEIDEKYPRQRKTREQTARDKQRHKSAAIHAQMMWESGWWA